MFCWYILGWARINFIGGERSVEQQKKLKKLLDDYVELFNIRTNIENEIFYYLVGLETHYSISELIDKHSDTIDQIELIVEMIASIRGNDNSEDNQIIETINSIQNTIRKSNSRLYNDCRL